jgi:hypothetical protein
LQTSQDILPIIAFVIVCFADTRINRLSILLIYALSTVLWTAFAFSYDDYFYGLSNACMTLFYVPIIFKLLAQKIRSPVLVGAVKGA